jgi:hypothetical protein
LATVVLALLHQQTQAACDYDTSLWCGGSTGATLCHSCLAQGSSGYCWSPSGNESGCRKPANTCGDSAWKRDKAACDSLAGGAANVALSAAPCGTTVVVTALGDTTALALPMKAGQYCYVGVHNQLGKATHTVALTLGGPGLLAYEIALNATAYVGANVSAALFEFPAARGGANYSARPIVGLGAPYALAQKATAVLFLVNNSTKELNATLMLAATDSATSTGKNSTNATGTGALSGLAIEFLSFAVLCFGVFVV